MNKLLLLIIVVFAVLLMSRLDVVQQAYKETFSEVSSTQGHHQEPGSRNSTSSELGSIWEALSNILTSDEELAEATQTSKHQELVEQYSAWLDSHMPAQREVILQIIKRDLQASRDQAFSLLMQPEKLDQIQEELAAFLKTENVRVYRAELTIRADSIRIAAQNPLQSDHIDWYEYHNSNAQYHKDKNQVWTKDEPIKLSQADVDALDYTLWPLSHIKFSAAATTYKNALLKIADIEEPKLPQAVHFHIDSSARQSDFIKEAEKARELGIRLIQYEEYLARSANLFKWSVNIDSVRADYRLETDANGKLIEFKRN
ncbi:MAG: hypothetical protein Q4G54_01780 [Pelistega sp.]|nr:hypothetical protein [Pelistega sp.]